MHRRTFLTAAGGGLLSLADSTPPLRGGALQQALQISPTRSVVPVVGDGHWVWKKPPQDQTGYLHPRQYELKVGVELIGAGTAGQIMATTPAPVQVPGQEIDRVQVSKEGCQAALRQLTPEAGQLILAAPQIVKGQRIAAAAEYRLTLYKDYQGHTKDRFPAAQPNARQLDKALARSYLYDSPGIQARSDEVKDLARRVGGRHDHPWDRARAFYRWVWDNIRPQVAPYTSVTAALRDRVGDCEEHAAVFVALCRASGIPARLVWVPNHNWAEFYLQDESGRGHWIAAHTSCYSWFGWTGAHELVLQKGDSIAIPEKRRPQRLLEDWMQWQGARPQARWLAELRPLPGEGETDAGPGARTKDAKGEWVVTAAIAWIRCSATAPAPPARRSASRSADNC